MKIIKGNFSDQNKKQKNPAQKKDQDIPIIQSGEEKYSGMLLDLIQPYMEAHPAPIEFERKVQLGSIAWNLASSTELNIPGYKDILKSAAKEAGLDKKQIDIIKKMAVDKQKKFPGQNLFIQNYNFEEDTDKELRVKVNCISFIDMMNETLDNDDDDFDYSDFDEDYFDEADYGYEYEEGALDRTAISVNYKPALIEWAKKINIVVSGSGGNVIYLIDETETEKETYDWLKKNFQMIMEDELEDITTKKRKWPKLSYEVFCDFFDVKFHSMIWDFERRPIKKY